MKAVAKAIPLFLPAAVRWASLQERKILREGEPLSAISLADARLMGVVRPERIRVLKVDHVPLPASRVLRLTAIWTGILTPDPIGMALRYGIFIRSDFWLDRRIVAHECVHTAQYERLGGFTEFLRVYLRECLEVGYLAAPLEQEAILKIQQLTRCDEVRARDSRQRS